MAKSFGNFYTLRDLLDKGWSGREVRYVLLAAHYRLPLNFTLEGLAGARSALQRLDAWQQRLLERALPAIRSESYPAAEEDKFGLALDDDLNISAALGCLFDLVRESNRGMDTNELTPEQARGLLDYWHRLNTVLVIQPETVEVPSDISALAEERQVARNDKDWRRSDQLRDKLIKKGWSVKDTKQGTKLTRTNL